MSIIATAVRHLMAAGVTGEPLVQAIADMEAARFYEQPLEVAAQPTEAPPHTAVERRRAWDRERKRKAKEAKASSNSTGIPLERVENSTRSTGIPPEHAENSTHSTGIPPEQVEIAERPSLPLPPNDNNSNPSAPTHPEGTTHPHEGNAGGESLPPQGFAAGDGKLPGIPAKPAAKRKRAKGVSSDELPLSADWVPILTPAAQAMVDAWPPGWFARELLAFQSHAAANGRVAKDWQAAFRTWLTNADRRRDENAHRSANHRNNFTGSRQPDDPDGFRTALVRDAGCAGISAH